MNRNKLYTTVIDKTDPEGAKITVKPSKYLKKLHPEDVIALVQAHIQSLKDDLIRYCQKDIDVARNRKRINKLGSEFDVAKMYLAHFKQTYEATALRRGAILELVFPPHYVSPVKRLFVILFLTLTIPVLAWSEQAVWQGKVVGVSDGDGVTVMHHGRSVIDPGSSEKHLFI